MCLTAFYGGEIEQNSHFITRSALYVLYEHQIKTIVITLNAEMLEKSAVRYLVPSTPFLPLTTTALNHGKGLVGSAALTEVAQLGVTFLRLYSVRNVLKLGF